MKTPNIDDFKAWARANHGAALLVFKAQAFAELERERVDAYIEPLFKSFNFEYCGALAEKTGMSGPLPSSKELYLCDDEERVKEYFKACARAHRAHGWQGEEEFCPALVAEHAHVIAENEFLREGCKVFGIDAIPARPDLRQRMLKLLLGACTVSMKEAGARRGL